MSCAIDGAGSLVELQTSAVVPGSPPGQQSPGIIEYLDHPLFRFAPGSSTGQLMASGVARYVIHGAGSGVVLGDQTTARPSLPYGQTFSTPVYDLVRFAPGSTLADPLAPGVSTIALDGSGSVVALGGLSLNQTTLAGGLVVANPVYSLVVFA